MLTYQPLPEAQQKRVAAIIVAKKGKSAAARLLGHSRQTIKAAAAGMPLHPYTVEELIKTLAERDREGKNP